MDVDGLNKKLNKIVRELKDQLNDIYSRLEELENRLSMDLIGFVPEDPYADFDEDDPEY
jgi:hypothetical protein